MGELGARRFGIKHRRLGLLHNEFRNVFGINRQSGLLPREMMTVELTTSHLSPNRVHLPEFSNGMFFCSNLRTI
uniref:Uncharacterized protein n=1 Tax=Arundo donax TaxID=35708 RepID=A0A0A8YAH4_ARUDO